MRIWGRSLTAEVLSTFLKSVKVGPVDYAKGIFTQFSFDSGEGALAIDSGTGHAWATLDAIHRRQKARVGAFPFQIDDVISVVGQVPILFHLNGSSASHHPLTIKFTRLPANGTVHLSPGSAFEFSDAVAKGVEYAMSQPFVFAPPLMRL